MSVTAVASTIVVPLLVLLNPTHRTKDPAPIMIMPRDINATAVHCNGLAKKTYSNLLPKCHGLVSKVRCGGSTVL
jgi:hypothetical protein